MNIRQAPKLFLSLLLLAPAMVSATEKPVATDPAKAVKVQPLKQQKQLAAYPKRGMSMKQVRKHYGEPQSIRKSKGKVKKQWPRITVWNYGRYSVYFERHLVLHTVVH